MNQPLVYQLFCQEHCWVAKLGIDKRWKHISAKLTPRLELIDSPEMTGLIGCRCKYSNVLSRAILINHLSFDKLRKLSFLQDTEFCFKVNLVHKLSFVVAIILVLSHPIPFRTRKWNTSRPMVVWWTRE